MHYANNHETKLRYSLDFFCPLFFRDEGENVPDLENSSAVIRTFLLYHSLVFTLPFDMTYEAMKHNVDVFQLFSLPTFLTTGVRC